MNIDEHREEVTTRYRGNIGLSRPGIANSS